MPGKEINIDKLKRSFEANVDLTTGKINYEEWKKRHRHGEKEKWIEMPMMSINSFFLNAFLLKLNVGDRLRAIKDFYQLSFDELKALGFGGSTLSKFVNSNITHHPLDDERLAKFSIILDIPIKYASVKNPYKFDVGQLDFLEYVILNQKIESIQEFRSLFTRPYKRVISGYRLNNTFNGKKRIVESNENYIYVRVDLSKTFFSIEFYNKNIYEMNFLTINKIIDLLELNIHYVVLCQPLFRDSKKIVFIGSYLEKQKSGAISKKDYLINNFNGELIYPYDLNFKNFSSQYWDLS